MDINTEILEQFRKSDSMLLAVTKYLDVEQTLQARTYLNENFKDVVFGLGENRHESLLEKKLPRDDTHFIGEIQSKKIKYVIDNCETIHSLDNIKHARKINDICESKNTWMKVFIQINVDPTKEGGIAPDTLGEFLLQLDELENIGVMGISAIGAQDISREEKEKEFDLLLKLRSKHLERGFISAGTSSDYEIALEKGIDIVRIGKKLFNNI